MNGNSIMACVLISVIAWFMIFNYMPAIMDLSALENERQVFLQLDNKVKELEQKLVEDNLGLKAKLVTLKKQMQKQIRAQTKREKEIGGKGGYLMQKQIRAQAEREKEIEGNRGYLIKGGEPQ